MRTLINLPAIPVEIRGLAALLLLCGEGSLTELRAMGYRIDDITVRQLSILQPQLELDMLSGKFNVPEEVPDVLDDPLFEALMALAKEGERTDMTNQERCFERLASVAVQILDSGDAIRSMDILRLTSQVFNAESDSPKPTPVNETESLSIDTTDQQFKNTSIPVLRIRLFGDLEMELNGQMLYKTPAHKGLVRTLLCFLVLNQGRGLPRDSVISWIWPGREPARALSGFYNLWHRLCGSLPTFEGRSPYFCNDEGLLRIDTRYVTSDISEFERLSRQVLFEQGELEERFAAIDRLEQLYRNDILAGLVVHQRIMAVQEHCRSTLLDVLLTASRLHLESSNNTMALWYARRAFEIDPKREDVYQVLMATQEATGQRTTAMDTYQECRRYLDEELGILPSKLTNSLYQDLLLDGQ